MSHIQSVIFDKKYWNIEDAENWLNYHNFNTLKKYDETHNSYRFRLIDPNYFKRFRSHKLNNGVTFVIGFKNLVRKKRT